jgi:hypothetical protein
MMAVLPDLATTAQIQAPTKQVDNAMLHKRVNVSNPLNQTFKLFKPKFLFL